MSTTNEKPEPRKVTLNTLREMKLGGEKIVCLTAYDASFAALIAAQGVEVLLVGDSLGMVIQGDDSTLSVSMDEMVYHTRAVSRHAGTAWLIADLPFMSYSSTENALHNAARLMAEGRAHMVKMEGAGLVIEHTERLSRFGIPVCGHLGLTPQAVHRLGGYRVQGRAAEVAEQLADDAVALQQAGACMLVLECVPRSLAARIAQTLSIPVIGIGAGADCDGQVLVLHDMLGITIGRPPRFARDFVAGADSIAAAVSAYVTAVKNVSFPAHSEGFD